MGSYGTGHDPADGVKMGQSSNYFTHNSSKMHFDRIQHKIYSQCDIIENVKCVSRDGTCF